MEIIKTINEMRQYVKNCKKEGLSIGLVPTMGYLHNGHGALIKKSVNDNDITVVSIFVNPTQFSINEDLDKYPRDMDRDSKLVKSIGGDVIFNPEPEEMYQNNITKVSVSGLSNKLCGITRPTHFDGVCQVVSKLFNIVTPDNAYFGLKDLQQYIIIKTMVDNLNFPVTLNPIKIVRDENGLALSSRNTYLTDDERKSALSLNLSLKYAKQLIEEGERDVSKIIAKMYDLIISYPYTKVDYIKIVDNDTLEDLLTIVNENYHILLAVYVGNTRLIDNYSSIV